MVCTDYDWGGEGKSSGDLGRLLLILAIYQKSSVINLTNQPLMKKMCFNKYVIQFQWKPKWDNALVWMQWLKAAVLAASKSIKLIFKMDLYRHIPNYPPTGNVIITEFTLVIINESCRVQDSHYYPCFSFTFDACRSLPRACLLIIPSTVIYNQHQWLLSLWSSWKFGWWWQYLFITSPHLWFIFKLLKQVEMLLMLATI